MNDKNDKRQFVIKKIKQQDNDRQEWQATAVKFVPMETGCVIDICVLFYHQCSTMYCEKVVDSWSPLTLRRKIVVAVSDGENLEPHLHTTIPR